MKKMVARSSWFFKASKHLMLVAVFAMGGFAQVASAGFTLNINYPKPANSFTERPDGEFAIDNNVIVQDWGFKTGPNPYTQNSPPVGADTYITKFDSQNMSNLGYTAEFTETNNTNKTAKISWTNVGYSISHILIKDGNLADPNWFLFRLPTNTIWTPNGTGNPNSIEFDTWFWNSDGSQAFNFSNITLWGEERAGGQDFDFEPFVVPEPFTAGLMLSGMACSALMMRRRRK
jgi:hypothetical protein